MPRLTRERKNKTVYRLVGESQTQGLIFNRAASGNGPSCVVDGKTLRNFGSCSYMGLERHPALLAGAVAALEHHGSQFSFSRAYLDSPLYQGLEEALDEITGRATLVAPSTTLAHLAALPVLVSDDDVVLIDQFAHASLHMATDLLKGTIVERIRHNRMVISLPGDVLFDSGRDELKGGGEKILLQVADVIQNDAALRDRQYQVAGHTDDQPLKRAADTFHDNWGLSLMRARQVLVFLVAPPEGDKAAKKAAPPPAPAPKAGKDAKAEKPEKAKPAPAKEAEPERHGGNLNPKHWSASGYGQTDPIVANDTPEGRKKNRRVELILMPDVEEMLDLKSLL